MKTLYNILSEGIFDVDSNIDNAYKNTLIGSAYEIDVKHCYCGYWTDIFKVGILKVKHNDKSFNIPKFKTDDILKDQVLTVLSNIILHLPLEVVENRSTNKLKSVMGQYIKNSNKIEDPYMSGNINGDKYFRITADRKSIQDSSGITRTVYPQVIIALKKI